MKITNSFHKLTGFTLFDWQRNRLNKPVFKWHYHLLTCVLWLLIIPLLGLQFVGLFWLFDKLRPSRKYRQLTPYEISELELVYENSINYKLIRAVEQSVWAKFGSRFVKNDHLGFVFFNSIHFSREIQSEKSVSDMAWLVHEVTHISQYQKYGFVYIIKALRAQRNGGYGYKADWVKKPLSDFNFEQQAELAKDYYLKLKCRQDTQIFKKSMQEIREQQFC